MNPLQDYPATSQHISKAELLAVLEHWGRERCSTAELQGWMLDYFEPMEFTIGEGEPEIVREAMHIVMNEYELADENKIVRESFQAALDFILCDESSFNTRKKVFLQGAFLD